MHRFAHSLYDLVIALSDDDSNVYVDEIKKRRYTKEFHSFVKSSVATRLESRLVSFHFIDHLHFYVI